MGEPSQSAASVTNPQEVGNFAKSMTFLNVIAAVTFSVLVAWSLATSLLLEISLRLDGLLLEGHFASGTKLPQKLKYDFQRAHLIELEMLSRSGATRCMAGRLWATCPYELG